MKALMNALNEGLIDKSTLLIKRYKHLGIPPEALIFLLKVTNLKETKYTINKLSKETSFTKKELDSLLALLVKAKIVKIKFITKEEIEIDLSKLWEMLLETLVSKDEISKTKEQQIENIKDILKHNWLED